MKSLICGLASLPSKDRLFGPAGPSQGGTAFVGEGQQYLPHGWVAVGNVSLVTNLQFRQVFSDDISQVIDPRRESTFYAYYNTPNFSFISGEERNDDAFSTERATWRTSAAAATSILRSGKRRRSI